jgi:hypothetical protein
MIQEGARLPELDFWLLTFFPAPGYSCQRPTPQRQREKHCQRAEAYPR